MVSLRGYLSRRLVQVLPVILIVIVLNFILIHMAPGDPALNMAGEWATAKQVEEVRIKWGLDRPIHEQLVTYLGNLMRGDLGYSYHYGLPVMDVIMLRLPYTLLLASVTVTGGIVLGTVLGVVCAGKYGRPTDDAITTIFLGFNSMPVFWLGLILIVTFALRLRLFPYAGVLSVGVESGWRQVLDTMWHMVLPSATLILGNELPVFMRVARASVIEVMSEDYITTVRAAGMDERSIFFRHALRNALVPVIQMAGLWIGLALTGVVLTETVFSWPGMGTLMFQAVRIRDYPLLMGIFLISSIWVVIALLLADIVSAIVDPRIAYK